MKLQTSIQPRRDGTVKVAGLDGKTYVFTPDADGELSADVGDDGTVAHLLAGGLFWPADEEDHGSALALAAAKPAPAPKPAKAKAKPAAAPEPAPAPAPAAGIDGAFIDAA